MDSTLWHQDHPCRWPVLCADLSGPIWHGGWQEDDRQREGEPGEADGIRTSGLLDMDRRHTDGYACVCEDVSPHWRHKIYNVRARLLWMDSQRVWRRIMEQAGRPVVERQGLCGSIQGAGRHELLLEPRRRMGGGCPGEDDRRNNICQGLWAEQWGGGFPRRTEGGLPCHDEGSAEVSARGRFLECQSDVACNIWRSRDLRHGSLYYGYGMGHKEWDAAKRGVSPCRWQGMEGYSRKGDTHRRIHRLSARYRQTAKGRTASDIHQCARPWGLWCWMRVAGSSGVLQNVADMAWRHSDVGVFL